MCATKPILKLTLKYSRPMPSPTIHHTFALQRSYAAAPERVFAAFADPAQKRSWFADGFTSHDVLSFELDFQVGGVERILYRFREGTPFPGTLLAMEGRILEIVPGCRVVSASSMAMAGRIFSASLVTADIVPTESGTDLTLTHQGAFFENSDGPELRQAGWGKLLDHLENALAA